MATLVLGTLGTLVGGPVGGALGAVLGRQVDASVIGSPRREGPRLKELAVSTSSYGQPIAALYGRTRAPGTIVWSTDLRERRETQGGGKGKPKTTTYSYSVSLAVALSSRPIERLGRIWADGNLLRGAAGDLKTGGTLRVHTGHADQEPDPLMQAALGNRCPAHRGCAYAVFEDLALEDFGNRIPALSFEVFAGSGARLVGELVETIDVDAPATEFPESEGFVHEGGAIRDVLALIDRLHPLMATVEGKSLRLEKRLAAPENPMELPEPASWDEGDFGREDGRARSRFTEERRLGGLRYYEPQRDYQPGLQRVEGGHDGAHPETLEFPGVFSASNARNLLDLAAIRGRAQAETLIWRVAQLDPELAPGALVRAPGIAGLWEIQNWEWRERGIELEMVRHVSAAPSGYAADGGAGWNPPDRLPVPTLLRAFELPWDGFGSNAAVQRYAAVGAATGRWPGAMLYNAGDGSLAPIGPAGPQRSVTGTLTEPLGSSNALRFEPRAELRVILDDYEAELEPATPEDLARGANRLLVDGEIVQFAGARPEGNGVWLLRGLLRGRGGTEVEAAQGHAGGAPVTLLDDRLTPIPESEAIAAGGQLAAIGIADDDPVLARLENAGRSRKPLFPVHGRATLLADGTLRLAWTRRVRGGWDWLDEVEQPLAEQAERYEVGLGDPAAPAATWTVAEPHFRIDPGDLTALAQVNPGAPLWVRQLGSHARSDPLFLATLDNPT